MNIVSFLEKRNKTLQTFLFYGLLFFVSYIDFIFGPDLSFSLFYLIPIAAISWIHGKKYGFIASIISAILWEIADQYSGNIYDSIFIQYWNWGVRFIFFIIVNVLVSELKKVLDREKEKATSDPLTGLSNFRSFYDFANMELKRAKRYDHNFALAYIDLDNFKSVNDTYGHLEGDNLLKKVACELSRNARSTDIVARMGGDEFVLMLTEITLEQAEKAMEKVYNNIILRMKKNNWDVTVSVGLVYFESYPELVKEMIKISDDVMYEVKKSGKDGIRLRVFK